MIYYKSNGARQRHLPGQNSVKGILFLLPMLTFAVIFVFYPFGQALVQSVSVVNFRGEITGFAGLDHFRYLFGRKEFSSALRNTLLLCGVNVPVTVVLTLLLAWMCRQKSPFHSIMETAFALLYTGLVRPGILPFSRLLELLHDAPCRRFGLGSGDRADLTLFDLNARYSIDPAEFVSMGKSTPFAGQEVYGRCRMTLCAGEVAWSDGTLEGRI